MYTYAFIREFPSGSIKCLGLGDARQSNRDIS